MPATTMAHSIHAIRQLSRTLASGFGGRRGGNVRVSQNPPAECLRSSLSVPAMIFHALTPPAEASAAPQIQIPSRRLISSGSQGQTRRSAPCRKCVRILLFPARWWPFEISCHRKGSGGDSGMVNSQGVSGWAGFGTDYARPGGDYSHLYRLQGGWLFRRAAWMAGSFDRNLTGDKNLAKAATGT